jgi:hypothetical protein
MSRSLNCASISASFDLERLSIRDLFALRRRPGSDLTSARPAGEILLRLFDRDLFGHSLDSDLAV